MNSHHQSDLKHKELNDLELYSRSFAKHTMKQNLKFSAYAVGFAMTFFLSACGGTSNNGHATVPTESKPAEILSHAPYVIPVVVHIVYADRSVPSIVAPKIEGALARTNDFFQGKIKGGLRDGFGALQGKLDIEFKLAQLDPKGNPTPGYEIIKPDNIAFALDGFKVYHDISSAYNWNSTRYLNIYVIENLNNGGVANMPTEWPNDPTYNAVFVDAKGFGNVGETIWQNRDELLAHEIGHAMNLKHTFGHNGVVGATCGDDGIADTPTTWGAKKTDYSKPSEPESSCGNTTNIENIMDYGSMPTMFTKGQIARVEKTLNETTWGRNNLWSSTNLIATGAGGNGKVAILKNGISNPVSLAKGTKKYYTIEIPEGADVSMKMSGGTGNANLYTLFSSAPSSTLFGAKSESASNDELISFTNSKGGTHYIMVESTSDVNGATLNVSFSHIRTLQTNVWNQVNLALGEQLIFRYDVPNGLPVGSKVLFRLEDGGAHDATGDANIYSGINQVPSLSTFKYKSENFNSVIERIEQDATPGTHYVLVNGVTAVKGSWLQARITP